MLPYSGDSIKKVLTWLNSVTNVFLKHLFKSPPKNFSCPWDLKKIFENFLKSPWIFWEKITRHPVYQQPNIHRKYLNYFVEKLN